MGLRQNWTAGQARCAWKGSLRRGPPPVAGFPTTARLPWILPPTNGLDNANHVDRVEIDRKSTRLNSSHLGISYAVFCLKKKSTWDDASGETATRLRLEEWQYGRESV